MPKKDASDKTNKVSKNELKLQERIEQLEKQVTEQEEITKRAQSDYIRLKMDMDALISRTEDQKKNLKVESLVSISQKVLPVVAQLKQTVDSMTDEVKESSWGSGVVLISNKMSASLQQLGIKEILTVIWTEPDLTKHMPISTQPVEDKKLQWKIVTQVEPGYLYDNDWRETIIMPAKVIVWQ